MTAINKLNKRARMLRGLIKFGEKPGDIYMIDHVPVLPPVFRPIYPLPNGQIEHSGLNGLYKDVMNINERVAAFKDMPPHQVEDLRSDMHEALHVLWGLKDGALSGRPYQGLVSIIKGRTSPKTGYFSKKLMARPMDTVGRSTIVPNPALHPDDIGLPESMAWKMFAPHIIGEMQKIGVSPLQATEEVEKRSSRAKSALLQVMANRQVLANRAPSLHKFSIMGFNPKLVDGDAIHMPPLVFKGFNADTDGDSMVGNIIIRDNGEVRVINIRDFPVQREYRHADGKILYEPKTGVEVLTVPGGVGPEWKRVEQFSRHSNLVMYRVKVSGVPSPLLLSEDSSMVTMDLKSDMRTRATKPQDSMAKLVPVSYRVDTPDVMPEAYDTEKGVATGYMIAAGFTRKKADGIGLVMPYREDARRKLMKSIRIVFPGALIERMKLSPAEFSRIVDSGIGKKVGGGRRGYFISGDMVHVLVKESFDPATFYLHFGAKSKAFKVGLAYGAALGMGSCRPKATKNTFNGFGHLHPASAFRFFCATAGIEIRFFRKGDQFTMLPGFMDVDSYAMWVAAEKAHGSAIFSSYTSSTRLYGKVLLVPKKTYGFDMEPKYIPVDYDLLKKSIAEVESAGAFKNSHVWRLTKLRFLAQDKKIHNACPLGLLLYFIGRMAKAAPAFERTTFWLYVQGSLSHECSYEIVTSTERLMEKMTAYDVSVEDAQVFCEIGGVSLKNTMMISAPISQRAVEEARSMHASQHLMNPGTGDLMMVPKNESMHGIYLMTRTGKVTGKKYPTFDAALADHAAGKLDDTDVIKVGDMVTTPGRIKVNMTLPESHRNFATQFDAKAVRKVLGDVARSSPKTYTDTAFNLKALGDEAGFTHGITIGLDDIAPPKRVRDGILNQASKKLALDRTSENARKIFVDSGLRDRLSEQLDAHYKDHPSHVWDMMKSGAFGKTDQGWQMIVAPVLINDGEGKPIPHPVTKSFSEGLNISDYWSTLYGQRKGMIDRALSTWEPGMINKEVVTAALGHTVSEADCGAPGSSIDLDDRSVFNRHLASDLTIDGVKVGKRGDVINNAIVHSAKKAGMTKIDAGSMKSCEAMNGVCQHDAGRNERNEHYPIGFNIGAHAATTICEPLTQGVMQNFHKGGTSFSKTIRGLDRVRQLVKLPQIVANSGAMSKVEGVVRKIDKLPSGDHRILISGGVDRTDSVTGKPNKVVELVPHSVGANMDLKVVEGQSVKRGQMISGGDPLPRDILDTQGIGAARDHIVNELHKTYKTGNNLDMDKRFFEVIAKVVSNHAYIDHPGDAKWHVKGDYLPLTRAHRMNAALTAKGLKPMTIHPELKGVAQVPMTSDDWVARLGGRYLKKSIIEAVSTGMHSDVGPRGHHVASYAMGIHYNDPWPGGARHQPGSTSGKGFEDVHFNGPISSHVMEVHSAPPQVKAAGFKKK
jgi:DNA-directed RNA polymerase beta' subunit